MARRFAPASARRVDYSGYKSAKVYYEKGCLETHNTVLGQFRLAFRG